MSQEFTVQKQQPIPNKQSFHVRSTNFQTPPPQSTNQQKPTILESGPYFNFYLTNNKLGPYQWEFVQGKQQIFRVNMTVSKNKKNLENVVLHDFMMIHQNSRIDKHMFRAIYMKKFVDDASIEYWPVFKKKEEEENKILDLFFISFIAESQGQFTSYQNVIPLITQISQAEQNRDYTIQIDSDGIDGYIAILKHQGKKLADSRLVILNQKKNQQMPKEYLEKKKGQINYFIKDIEDRDIYINPFNNLNPYAFYEIQALNKRTEEFHDRHTLSSKYPKYSDQKFSKTIEEIKKKYINNPELEKSEKGQKRGSCFLEQMYLGDCYFHAAIHQVIKKASFIINKMWIFYAKDLNHVCVVLNIDGSIVPVEISEELMTHQYNQQLFYAMFATFGDIKNVSETQMYYLVFKAILIQKSFARVFREYKNLAGGEADQVFMMLTNSCSKIYKGLTKPECKQQIEQMSKWMEQVDNLEKVAQEIEKIQQKLKQMKPPQVPNEKQYNVYHYKMANQPNSQAENENDIRLIAITFLNNLDKLNFLFKDSLREQKQELAKFKPNISDFVYHSYSFHGIYNHHNNEDFDTVYIKLRDPRGKNYARYWRALWDHTIDKQKIIVKDSNQQTQKQTYEILDTHQTIECQYNQYLLTYNQLRDLKAETTVCTLPLQKTKLPKTIEDCQLPLNCYKSFDYRSLQIPLEHRAQQHYKIKIKKPGWAWICLHKKNQRHGFDAIYTGKFKQDSEKNSEITKIWALNYPEVLFRLYVSAQVKDRSQDISTSLFFVEEDKIKQVFYFKYYFEKDEYDLKLCLSNGKDESYFYVLSILSNISQNLIMVDPQPQVHNVKMRVKRSQQNFNYKQNLQIYEPISKRVDLFTVPEQANRFVIQYYLQWKIGSQKLKTIPKQLIKIQLVKAHKKAEDEIDKSDQIQTFYPLTNYKARVQLEYLDKNGLKSRRSQERAGRLEISIYQSKQQQYYCLFELIKASDFAQNVKLAYVVRFEKTQEAEFVKQLQKTEKPCYEVFYQNCQTMAPAQKSQQKEIKDL